MAAPRRRLGRDWQRMSADWRAKQIEYTWVRSLAGRRITGISGADAGGAGMVAARHGIADPALLADVLAAYRRLDAYPEVPALLRRLRERGIARAILSNGEPGMLATRCDAAGIAGLLDDGAERRGGGRVQARSAGLSAGDRRFGLPPSEIGVLLVQSLGCVRRAAFGFRVFWVNRIGAAGRIRTARQRDRADGPLRLARRAGVTPAARIAAAIELLAAIEAAPRRPADAVANDFFRARRFIGSGDRRAVSDRVWRVLRTHGAWPGGWRDQADAAPAGRRLAAAGRLALAGRRAGVLRRPVRPRAAGAVRAGGAARLEGHTLDHPSMPDAVRLEMPDWLLPPPRFGRARCGELALCWNRRRSTCASTC